MNRMKRILILLLVLTEAGVMSAQFTPQSKIDLFMGTDLHYRDIVYGKVYEVLLNLTPGIKWEMGKHWQLAGQALVPVYNDYGGRYKKVRLNMAVLSKEWDWNRKQFIKVSGGLFGEERYGLDVKWMYPVNNWLALNAQVGWTGFCSMAVDWEASKMERLTGWGGARVYLDKINMEMRIEAGRYLYKDYGVTGEVMRHFKHCTVGMYAQYSSIGKENGGFKVIMMIPPYHRKKRKLTVRPASNFRLTYNEKADPYSARTYRTDPEENEREGNFDRKQLDWGANRMKPDFDIKEGGAR